MVVVEVLLVVVVVAVGRLLKIGDGDGGDGGGHGVVVVDHGSNGACWWQWQGCYRILVVKVVMAAVGLLMVVLAEQW